MAGIVVVVVTFIWSKATLVWGCGVRVKHNTAVPGNVSWDVRNLPASAYSQNLKQPKTADSVQSEQNDAVRSIVSSAAPGKHDHSSRAAYLVSMIIVSRSAPGKYDHSRSIDTW